jgi:hypothetical protein
MTTSTFRSIDLLPAYLKTDKNLKFLSSTLDQLIQPAQIERISGYVGTKVTPTYISTSDQYIPDTRKYQISPALVINNADNDVQDVISYDDLYNEIVVKGGVTDNLDRLFNGEMYSYDPHIDWDKLINYQEYFWLVTGPDAILIRDDDLVVESNIIGKAVYSFISNSSIISLSNGMMVKFSGLKISKDYQNKQFFVEGVGTSIKLIDYDSLSTPGIISTIYNENFDASNFDDYPFDGDKTLPITPEYITINRASRDLNPWSRYNRWVHKDVIATTAIANGVQAEYPSKNRARRPIIEFSANLKLFNFGSVGIKNVDYIDNTTLDAFSIVEGSPGYYIDGESIQAGQRVVFNADLDPIVRGRIYQVSFNTYNGISKLTLNPATDNIPSLDSSVGILKGTEYSGSCWWFNGDKWVYAQQHTAINQSPLFDLFDKDGKSYSKYISNFIGNKIFGYSIGTSSVDTVLGFSLDFRTPNQGIGSYLFSNYFTSETITVTSGSTTLDVPTAGTYCKFSLDTGDSFKNVWTLVENSRIPILQFETMPYSVSGIEISVFDDPSTINFNVDVSIDFKKLNPSQYTINIEGKSAYVDFVNSIPTGSNVLLKIYSDSPPNKGTYELPLSLTNNPLNGPISKMSLTDIQDHVNSMVEKSSEFYGDFPGVSNLRDISNISKYGTRLISNGTPIVFPQLFLGKKEHNIVDALSKSADDYAQFKSGFLYRLSSIDSQLSTAAAVDLVLLGMNSNRHYTDSYYLSDMLAYGTNVVVRQWTVTDSRNNLYSLSMDFDTTVLSTQAVLVYLNDNQLLYNINYNFVYADSKIRIITELSAGDVLLIKYYPDTTGSYIPPTPTKLGLYPKFTPSKYLDNTYATPTMVIQGHDGSIFVAYNDYRDDIILELEKRIYNNIKIDYRSDLLDPNSILPGAFRKSKFSSDEITKVLLGDFIKWTGTYGIDPTTNTSFSQDNPFTWNYQSSYSSFNHSEVNGYWRGIYKYFYDTDRPHTHPWEMLGLSEKPTWWNSKYGIEPYTSGNKIMWDDIEAGRINGVVNEHYIRHGLSQIIPVDDSGNLLDPSSFLVTNYTASTVREFWNFGDQGPAETAWRRSSHWPFALQKLIALISPLTYTSKMYDVSRMVKNKSGQWTYGSTNEFLNIKKIVIPEDISTLTGGYSVYLIENGLKRNKNYISDLKSDIKYFNYNLFHKVGGFVSKNSLEITIDAIDPISTGPGALLSKDDYSLILNTSNPIKSINISGLIIQRSNGNYLVKGYDLGNPYFNTYPVVRNSNSPTLNIGGVSSPYVTWTASTTTGKSGLNSADTTTAESSPTQIFYNQGQIVKYENSYYIVTSSHRSESSFNLTYYKKLSVLPLTGGATVQTASRFDRTKSMSIPYGTEFSSIQEVYDLIVGYGEWLKDQGFIFDDFNSDFGESIDWNFSAKEFLFWTTQNWGNNNIITLSPFANKVQYSYPQSVVNNIFDDFYDYKILNSSGGLIPKNKISVTRDDGLCTVTCNINLEGIYFATFRSVQKEHGIIFNNKSIFGDVIYSVETGYYQKRMLINGFRTANWNGDYFSPGFIYDTAQISKWKQFTDYRAGTSVFYAGNYYSAKNSLIGAASFNFNDWKILLNKPTPRLIPNLDYKINQFNDFYNLDINNFDENQQKLAQRLTGYSSRPYLNNIITDPTSQYKFYQGFIKEKGTQNAISKLARSTINNYQGNFTYNEEWAFRIGKYGSYTTYQELEIQLEEGTFVDNPQIIVLTEKTPILKINNLSYYSTASTWQIIPDNYVSSKTFPVVSGTYLDNSFILPTAGYVRLDDVTYTTLNNSSLANIASSLQFAEGDTIWVGFSETKGWDVYRYTVINAGISTVYINDAGTGINVITDTYHTLKINDLISISNYDATVNGVYTVKEVPNFNSFVVASSATYVNYTEGVTGNLFKFSSARFGNFDDLPDNKEILKLSDGSKIWVDTDNSGKWAVYEKRSNYNTYGSISTGGISDQQLGWSISKRNGSNLVVVGSPGFNLSTQHGRVTIYTLIPTGFINEFFFYLDEITSTSSHSLTSSAEFGYCVVYDDMAFSNTGNGLVFTGAPAASTTSSCVESGLVKISSLNFTAGIDSEQLIIKNPSPVDYARFGSSLYVQRNTSTNKLLVVGAPGNITNNTGTVYVYTINSTNTVTSSLISTITVSGITKGAQWGHSISGSDDASIVAISAVGNSNTPGFVRIYSYNGSTLTFKQEISSDGVSTSEFGYKTLVSSDGTYLFVSAPKNVNYDNTLGAVYIYKNTNGMFSLDQKITNPVSTLGLRFGIDIDINPSNDSLIVSTLGSGVRVAVGFDDAKLTFDSAATYFYDTIDNSGVVYLYNRYNERFVVAEEIDTVSLIPGTNFGRSIVIDSSGFIVGAPAYDNAAISSSIYYFNNVDQNIKGWDKIYGQEDLVDLTSVKRLMLVDSLNEEVMTYLDIFDPLKGRLPGIADQEITYKLADDPAIYSVGLDTTTINVDSNWTDNNVGELWWDISTAKYQWYEQGDATFRKNHWGALFPGASIDIYEWVRTPLLPSEWSSLADTAQGLVYGISGQPLHPDDTVYSSKHAYDPNSGQFSRVTYYYWVKNSSLIPNVKNRRVSTYDVSSVIKNPNAYGLQFATPISSNSLILSNIAGLLIDKTVNLNIATDSSNTSIPKHTEWVLLEEGSNSNPPEILERKFIDSLLGRDSMGNLVPDPMLSPRQKYGIEFRPRQSMFKDRLSALRNLTGYINDVLSKHIITGNYSFKNLNASEPIPNEIENLYDQIVEDIDELNTIDANLFKTAKLECTVQNGKIRSVSITDPGRGYNHPPTVTIDSSKGSGAIILTEIDNFGKVISVTIDSAGSGYMQVPLLTVRAHTVIVLSDASFTGKWARYEYNENSNSWVRKHTQRYNTPLYWKYIDWASSNYNQHLDYTLTLNYVYEIEGLLLSIGDYVKINDNGLGNYIILEFVSSGGNFSSGFDIVYAQKGTIEVSDTIWNHTANPNDYDSVNSTYDQTLYDQTPNTELRYIISALKDNLFINELKSYWNLLFFKAVKYSHSEQKLLDWAFKTSFINIKNDAGNLGQPSVYKLIGSNNFENYIKEVKPFHTQLRNFTESYSIIEPSNSSISDFETLTSPTDISSNPVRNMDITIKFDRITGEKVIDDLEVVDKFVCNGHSTEFELSWLAYPEKNKITVTLNGMRVLWADYKIIYYTKDYNGYSKKVCKIVFLNYVPSLQKLLKIVYVKNTGLLSSTDRILNYYKPTSGSPGLELDQLMSGIKYPKTEIKSLPFNYSTDWSMAPFDTATWGSDYGYYSVTTTTSTSSTGTSIITLSNISGIKTGYYVNVISTTTNPFISASPTITNITGTTITVSSSLSIELDKGAKLEFWSSDSNLSILDSEIIGGDLGYTKAVGTGTHDLIIDGYSLYNADANQAPEELVPGGVMESLGINVYTKVPKGAPAVYSGIINVTAFELTTATLKVLPFTSAGIIVSSNKQQFTYVVSTTTNLLAAQFTIDWDTSTITLKSSYSGPVGYTIIGMGGGSGYDAGVVDYNQIITNESSAQVVSSSDMNSIGSVFVTVNGQSVPELMSPTDFGYVLTKFNDNDNRASVIVYNMPYVYNENTVQVWFFASKFSYFNEINEQIIPVVSGQNSYQLTYPPSTIGPESSQVIVELVSNTGQRYILNPPEVSYYQVTDLAQLTFRINHRVTRGAGIYLLTNNNAGVYVNGIKLRPGFDFTMYSGVNPTITLKAANIGDVIAIEDRYLDADFTIDGALLNLTTPTLDTSLVVTTFADQDGMLIRSDKFTGTQSGRYQISRPALNANCVWIWKNGISLIPNIDYAVLSDKITVQISDSILTTDSDDILIMSVSDQNIATTTIGYRIFNDMFNRTNFKRLSAENSTYLSQPLSYTDTEIYVSDAGTIIPPNPYTNVPGVVIIAGERIEFYKKTGNVLSQLRRSTLGTSPKFYSEMYTKVIDQSPDQTIPFVETILKQVQFTTSTSKVYIISLTTSTVDLPYSTSKLVSDGIELSTSSNIPAIDQVQVYYGGRLLNKTGTYHQDITKSYDSPEFRLIGSVESESSLPDTTGVGHAYIVTSTNQVWVYTRSLLESANNGYEYTGLTYQPPEFSIDINIPTVSVTETVTGGQPPTGSGWVFHETTATMQIQPGWIMQDANGAKHVVESSGHNTLFNGWGVGFSDSITISWPLTFIGPALQQITLNIQGDIGDNIKLVVIKKQIKPSELWNNGISLLSSNSAPAEFLRSKPAELPDMYYYGGDPTLTTGAGFALTDDNNDPLEGL